MKLQRAHATALADAGLLTGTEADDLLRGLDRIADDHLGCACPASDAEDLHTWVEGALTALVGDAGKKIHTARSRNDQVATLLVLYTIASGESVGQQLTQLVEKLCNRAKDWSELAFPLQTHQQFAAPGTVGFWALRFATTFQRIDEHLQFLVHHWKTACPLGSGAVAGSTLTLDRGVQASELGFEGPSLNALASTSTRDECIELLAVLAQIALHLQSFATDVICFSQTPLGWTRYPQAFGTGSSMMPNKTNPDAMELLRGEACGILATHTHALTLLKGLPSGYNRDLQCIKPLLHDAVEKTMAMCEIVTEFVAALDFNKAKLTASLGQGHVDATARMEASVAKGMPLRDAHHAVADQLASTTESADAAAGVVHAYRTIGSASPAETRRVADQILARLAVETA